MTSKRNKKTPPKKKVSPKKKKTPSKKKSKAPSGKPNYSRWTKARLIDELNAVMDILETKGKVLKIEKVVEAKAPARVPSPPPGPFEIDIMMNSGAPVTLRNPNDVVGFLKGQNLVKEATVR